MTWQKIETAPRDHFVCLVWRKNRLVCAAFRDVTWTWWQVPATQPLDWQPTHWMHLPAPPGGEE